MAESELVRRVRLAMVDRGWNQTDLAREAGVNKNTVSDFMNDKGGTSKATVAKITTALGLTPGTLEGSGEDEEGDDPLDLLRTATRRLAEASMPLDEGDGSRGAELREIEVELAALEAGLAARKVIHAASLRWAQRHEIDEGEMEPLLTPAERASLREERTAARERRQRRVDEREAARLAGRGDVTLAAHTAPSEGKRLHREMGLAGEESQDPGHDEPA